MNVLAIIPARGGSKGIPRKNVRLINGKPLISYPIRAALQSKLLTDVVVSTESQEISHISRLYGADVIERPNELAEDHITLDPVVHYTLEKKEELKGIKYDYVVTIQATSPLLTSNSIDKAIGKAISENLDNIISVVDDRHLTWSISNGIAKPNYEKRVNRQQLPSNFKETGGVFVSKREIITRNSRFGERIGLIELPFNESIDIDSEADWWVAEKLLQRRKILFRVDGDSLIGMGHIYRTLLLAYRMIDHEVCFLTDNRMKIGLDKLNESNFRVLSFNNEEEMYRLIYSEKPEIVINDILDTELDYINNLKVKGYFVVNFEDLGQGTYSADIVINALYDEKYKLKNHFWGHRFFCLKDEFHITDPVSISEKVKKILITFGGTDPNNYTLKVLKVLAHMGFELKIEVILGLGYGDYEGLVEEIRHLGLEVDLYRDVSCMSQHMKEADLIFTSAGRTIYEIASLGVPNIVLAQNERELHHTFSSADNGIVNLKLGYDLPDNELEQTIYDVMNNYSIRETNHKLMLETDLRKGIDNVLGTIFTNYEKWEKEND